MAAIAHIHFNVPRSELPNINKYWWQVTQVCNITRAVLFTQISLVYSAISFRYPFCNYPTLNGMV